VLNNLVPSIIASILIATSSVFAGGSSNLPTIAVGDVIGGNAAIIVTAANGTGSVTVTVARDAAFTKIVSTQTVSVTDPQVPGKIFVSDLVIGRRYYARVTDGSATRTATFVTGATPIGIEGPTVGVRFGVSGDWRGDVGIFNAILNVDDRNLDFFVKLGDTIYADVPSPAVPNGHAQTLSEFRAKHVENYAANHGIDPWGDLAASTATFSMIDDHEVTNDFAGGVYDPVNGWYNESPLYTNGLQAFVEHNAIFPGNYPFVGDARVNGRPMLYRSFQWGADAAAFMLDTRSFRDAELAPVTNPLDPVQVQAFMTASFNPARTMLGYPQLGTLLLDLSAAERAGITWKFILTPEPMQNFGVLAAEDRWEGYAAERAYLLGQIKALGIRNVVFVTADFHGTIVNDVTAPNPANPTQQLYTGMFEIITGAIAYSAPAGPTFAQIGLAYGLLSQQQYAFYQSLPSAGKDLFIGSFLDGVIANYGYSPTGIQDPSIQASFTTGGAVAAHSYGWTEFEIDAVTKALTISTYGCDWYTPAEAAADPAAIIARPITVRQKFVVTPHGAANCAADINGDGSVTSADLAVMFSSWGACGSTCPADLNHDGLVNGDDLTMVLNSWGDC
jgi:3-phytase/alkaline phosphatase D